MSRVALLLIAIANDSHLLINHRHVNHAPKAEGSALMGSAYGAGWHLPLGLLAWLATTDLRLWIYDQRALYGAMRFLHLVSMACFVGGVAVNEFRRLNASTSAAVTPVRSALSALMHWSFMAVLITGVWLFLRDPLGMGLHTMFLPKLVLVAAGWAYAQAARRPGMMPRRVLPRRIVALASTMVWIAIVGLSTWNHVERPANVNAALRATNTGRD
jgi:hypothetical protein